MPTKSEQILALYDGVRSCQEIAAMVGTTDSYVRTVARQRRGRSICEAEIRWKKSPLGKATIRRIQRETWQRIRADPERLQRAREARKERYRRQCERNYAAVAAKGREYYERNRLRKLAYQHAYRMRAKSNNKSITGQHEHST